ncbi:MAG TPA: ABC-F family ATP-binding cassette domain-containing protein, partial [Terriglobales bacterium]|nr:ABC-F family ATP-binding cassette domain-containing protein [Terriglobales bacterium]
MIHLSAAGKRYGHKLLFENLDWMITPQERVGIVGANGTGKSTLLKVLAGIESLDYGKLNATKGLRYGYLPQDGLSLSGRSVFAECLSVFSELHALERELESLSEMMAELDHAGAEYAAVAERFHRVENEIRTRDGYATEAQVGAVLTGLGFKKEDWTRRTEEFSGGWQMRLALAKLLLEKPNLLLLDEPTNHLDLETRNWLEDFLNGYPYAYVLISHDRYFLDVTVKKIAEIWNKHVHFYSGNYDKYLLQKAERRAQLESAYKNQRDKVEQLEAFINRFRAQATKAKQVQSRIKELEKIERIEIPPEEKTIHFTFPQPPPSGRMVAEAQGLGKSYGEKTVFANADFVIERGDRIALVGVNGAGKSTLIKLLSGSEPPTQGTLRLGHNVEADYFAQDQYKELDVTARVLDDISTVAPRAGQTELRNLLGCFLFTEDDVFKTIGVLSGGERNRYALARMLLRPSNFLLMDEPTNHLDMRAKDVLLESLQKFTGTVVFVSHDRYFIDKLATRVFEIGEEEVHIFPGNYEDYLYRKEKGADAEPTEAALEAPEQKAAPQNGNEPKIRRLNPIKQRQMEER